MIELSSWLDEFLAALDNTFARRVWFAGIQGSYARGEATASSDIDPVVVLDTLSPADIRAYSGMLDALPHRELACGFLSGKAELMAWEPSDLFQFCHDTRPLRGSLDEVLAKVTPADVDRAIKIGACNIHHGCVHAMVHGRSADSLREMYKTASFVARAVCYKQTGRYIHSLQELLCAADPFDQPVIRSYMRLKSGETTDFGRMSEALFAWSGEWIRRIK